MKIASLFLFGLLTATAAFGQPPIADEKIQIGEWELPYLFTDLDAVALDNFEARINMAMELNPALMIVPASSEISINVDQSTQKMVVAVNGQEKHTWKVSTGKNGPGMRTPPFKSAKLGEVNSRRISRTF